MSEARKKAINARMKTGYTLDDFQTLFEKAEASDFLKGKHKPASKKAKPKYASNCIPAKA